MAVINAKGAIAVEAMNQGIHWVCPCVIRSQYPPAVANAANTIVITNRYRIEIFSIGKPTGNRTDLLPNR